MVPEAGSLEANAYANTLLTKSPLHPLKRFPIPQYRPRDGRCPGRDDWEHSIAQLCTALGMAVEELDEEPPTPPSSPYSVTPSHDAYSPYASHEDKERLDKWLTINTTLYYHIAPSLTLTGLYREQDQKTIEQLVSRNRALADGRGLVKWVRSFSDVSGLELQADLSRKYQDARVKAGSTQAQLLVFLHMQKQRWLLINNNDPNEPYQFYRQLLIAMPSQGSQPAIAVQNVVLTCNRMIQTTIFKRLGTGVLASMDHPKDFSQSCIPPPAVTIHPAAIPALSLMTTLRR